MCIGAYLLCSWKNIVMVFIVKRGGGGSRERVHLRVYMYVQVYIYIYARAAIVGLRRKNAIVKHTQGMRRHAENASVATCFAVVSSTLQPLDRPPR